MERSDRFLTGNAWRDDFAPTRVTCHEMGLDQTHDDPQIGIDQMAVEDHRNAIGWGAAKIDHPSRIAGKVVLDADVVKNPLVTDDFKHLFAKVWSVQTGGNKDRDLRMGYACRLEFLYDSSKDRAIGNRSRDIADDDANASRAFGHLLERLACHCVSQGFFDGLLGVIQQRHGRLANHHGLAAFGERDWQFAFSVPDLNPIEHPTLLL